MNGAGRVVRRRPRRVGDVAGEWRRALARNIRRSLASRLSRPAYGPPGQRVAIGRRFGRKNRLLCALVLSILRASSVAGGCANDRSMPPGPTWRRFVWAPVPSPKPVAVRSEEHTSELQSRLHLVCRLLLEKKTGRIMFQPLRYTPLNPR